MQPQTANLIPTHAGGANSQAIAVAAATTPLKANAGRVARVTITVAGTTSFTIWDNPSAASGVAVFVSPAATSIGQIFDIQMPCQLGITVQNTATGPGFTISWD